MIRYGTPDALPTGRKIFSALDGKFIYRHGAWHMNWQQLDGTGPGG